MDKRKEAPCPGRPSLRNCVTTNDSQRNTTSAAPVQPSDNLGRPPADFDAAVNPIIGKHIYGLPSPEEARAEIVADLVFQRQVLHLHHLGPRATGELLAEIGVERSCRTVIDRKLTQYGRFSREHVEIAGGSDFWPWPLRLVGGRR